MTKELNKLYAHRMMWMDKYIKEHVADEDLIDYWLVNGVPDGCEEKDLLQFVDVDYYIDSCKLFTYILFYNDGQDDL